MPNHGRQARWRQYLTPDEQVELAALDEAIEMHRKLMAPLFAELRRVTRLAASRMGRAQAQQQSDAA